MPNYFRKKQDLLRARISIPLLAFSSISIGLYPLLYFVLDPRFGLLSTKPEALLSDPVWRTAFYGHIVFGGLSLLSGWTQFVKSWRSARPEIHRNLGKAYVVFVFLSATGALYSSFFASTGWIASLGFFSLGVFWIGFTALAFAAAKRKEFRTHERFMTYSFAAPLAAVTLRIWLPLLLTVTGDFTVAYPIVAWLCWVPNLAVVYFFLDREFSEATTSEDLRTRE